jgi:hypothetical protein
MLIKYGVSVLVCYRTSIFLFINTEHKPNAKNFNYAHHYDYW